MTYLILLFRKLNIGFFFKLAYINFKYWLSKFNRNMVKIEEKIKEMGFKTYACEK